MSDVSCQTEFDSGNGSEDTQDALRINPFLRGGEKKGANNSNQTENVAKKNSTIPEIRVAKRVCSTPRYSGLKFEKIVPFWESTIQKIFLI